MHTIIPMPSQAQLAAAFDYDKDTGSITNKLTGHQYKKRKYQRLSLNGERYLAHRVAWKLMTGAEPVGVIDHINNDQADNRWVNLQDIPERVNHLKDLSLPVYPPYYFPRCSKWVVRSSRAGVKHYASFETEAEALAYAADFRAETSKCLSVKQD